jgi:hypothetical protein
LDFSFEVAHEVDAIAFGGSDAGGATNEQPEGFELLHGVFEAYPGFNSEKSGGDV